MKSYTETTLNSYIRSINRAIDFVDLNINKNLSLAEMSDVARYSQYHFHRIFSSIKGETIHQYTQRTRIAYSAEKMIWNYWNSIDEIAEEFGFSSLQSYSRSFRQYYKTTPYQFRAGNRFGCYYLDKEKRIYNAVRYIDDNLDKELSLDKLASIACYSKYHFHKTFFTVLGERVFQYIQRKRLLKGAGLLINNSKKSITEIAHDCGFAESNNFSRAFKISFLTTPREFRENKKYWEPLLCINQPENNNFTFRIKEMPDFHIAYTRHYGPRADKSSGQLFMNLLEWANKTGLINAGSKLIWSPLNSKGFNTDDKLISDTCLTVPENIFTEGIIGTRTMPGGKYAAIICKLPVDVRAKESMPDVKLLTTCSEIMKSNWDFHWVILTKWMIENNYIIDVNRCSYAIYTCQVEASSEYEILIPLQDKPFKDNKR